MSAGSSILRSLPFTRQAHVHIRDARHVEKVLQNMVAGGRAKLRVISDFDQTFSGFMNNGKHVINSIQVITRAHFQGVDEEKLKEIYMYYSPKISSATTVDEKVRLSSEYWPKLIDVYVAAKLSRQTIFAAIQNTDLPLRTGCSPFMDMLHKNDVPILVFSAGLGDVIQVTLEKANLVYPKCEIVANFMKFDIKGYLVGWHDPLVFNVIKNKAVLNESYFKKEPERTNVLLLGDSLNDLQMADGVPVMENILKIGYLNGKEEMLAKYKESFDIVLVNDETMDVANAILNQVIDSPNGDNQGPL